MIWDTQFGKICKNRSLTGETPTTRQALQYSSSFTISTWPLVTRANPGTLAMPMARMTFMTPFPKTVIKIMANRMNGKENMPSMIRMNTASIHPPKYPAVSPIRTPMIAPTMVAPTATIMEIREP